MVVKIGPWSIFDTYPIIPPNLPTYTTYKEGTFEWMTTAIDVVDFMCCTSSPSFLINTWVWPCALLCCSYLSQKLALITGLRIENVSILRTKMNTHKWSSWPYSSPHNSLWNLSLISYWNISKLSRRFGVERKVFIDPNRKTERLTINGTFLGVFLLASWLDPGNTW